MWRIFGGKHLVESICWNRIAIVTRLNNVRNTDQLHLLQGHPIPEDLVVGGEQRWDVKESLSMGGTQLRLAFLPE